MNSDQTFSLDELCALVDLPRRTVRYYIQIGLVDRPDGLNRGARYTRKHLEKLLFIRKWQDAGLSLERIGELLATPDGEVPPPRPRQAGAVEVWSRVLVREGLEVHIEPGQAGLTPEETRDFLRRVAQAFEELRRERRD